MSHNKWGTMKKIIKKVLQTSRDNCKFKIAFIPKGWTCVNIEKCSQDIADKIKKEMYVCGTKNAGL